MILKIGLALALLALMPGCDDIGRSAPAAYVPPPPPAPRERGREMVTVTGSRVRQYNLNFTVSHEIELYMQQASVKPRFERARDLCLNDPAYECVLRSATITSRNYQGRDYTTAELDVLVRKEKAAGFEAALRAPVDGEIENAVRIGERKTSAENVTASLEDRSAVLARKTQLRDRFLELQKRPNLGAEDLIKIEEQLSELNADINELTESLAKTKEEVAKDRLEITLRTETPESTTTSEFGKVWAEAGEILTRNVVAALRFLIASIPWIPFAVLGLFVAFRLIRAFRRP